MNRETVAEMIKCAKREVAQRQRVYPRLVERGKMTQKKADYEIKMMSLIEASLTKIYNGVAEQQVQTALFDTKEYAPQVSHHSYY